MLALIFTRADSPTATWSSAAWWTLAGMIIPLRASSSRISSGASWRCGSQFGSPSLA
jgi:hypothetical protein